MNKKKNQKGGENIVSASIDIINSMINLGNSIFNEVDSIVNIKSQINSVSQQTSISPSIANIPQFNRPNLNN